MFLLLSIQCDSLQRHLEIVNDELNDQRRKYTELQRSLQIADEDLVCFRCEPCRKWCRVVIFFVVAKLQATTRINYEEQISVMTEQVISLSDQLAELKWMKLINQLLAATEAAKYHLFQKYLYPHNVNDFFFSCFNFAFTHQKLKKKKKGKKNWTRSEVHASGRGAIVRSVDGSAWIWSLIENALQSSDMGDHLVKGFFFFKWMRTQPLWSHGCYFFFFFSFNWYMYFIPPKLYIWIWYKW